MVIDCTLDELKVPGFSGVNPPFGTKKPAGQSITAREADVNIRMAFARQRPYHVGENSVTSEIQAHSTFLLEAAEVTLTLGTGAFTGCSARVFNASNGNANVVFGMSGSDIKKLKVGDYCDLVWHGGMWKIAKGAGSGASSYADMVEGLGRNLLEVLGVTTIAECFAEFRRRCNNNGEIDASGIPDFSGIELGDYIDGLDLSEAEGQVWNGAYKNNRILVSGFNTYKGMGDTENTKNHILFTFRNIVLKRRMKSSDANAGGYNSSELKTFLEGTFKTALNAQLDGGTGENYLYGIRKDHSTKSSSGWATYTVFPPSEIEVFGVPYLGDEGVYLAADAATANVARASSVTNIQFPIYQKSYEYIIKRWNGARDWWWLSTPYSASSASFCIVFSYGYTSNYNASTAGGVAPAFCVA